MLLRLAAARAEDMGYHLIESGAWSGCSKAPVCASVTGMRCRGQKPTLLLLSLVILVFVGSLPGTAGNHNKWDMEYDWNWTANEEWQQSLEVMDDTWSQRDCTLCWKNLSTPFAGTVPVARSDFGMTSHEGVVYVFGGDGDCISKTNPA